MNRYTKKSIFVLLVSAVAIVILALGGIWLAINDRDDDYMALAIMPEPYETSDLPNDEVDAGQQALIGLPTASPSEVVDLNSSTAKPERLSKPPDFHSQIQAESESAGKLTLDIRGLVLDDLGQPVPKAEISIVQSLNYSKSTMKDWKVKNLRTDVEGRYHHSEDIKTGEYFSYIDLTIRFIPGDTGLLTSARQIKSIRNNISETVDFRLRKGGSFSGRLVDKYGSPVPHCNMGYKSAGGHPSRLLTDKNGRFTSWTSLPTAYYSLCVCRSSNRSSSNRMGVYRPLDDSLSWLITASFHTDISDIIVVGRTGIRVTIDSKTVYD